jgi:hypothetical protein
MANFNLLLEVLTFSNWAFIYGFFLNFALGSIAFGPLDFDVIYKTTLGFQFNQFSP